MCRRIIWGILSKMVSDWMGQGCSTFEVTNVEADQVLDQ